MLYLLPLLLALALLVPVALAPVNRRVSLALSRVALPVFGTYVTEENSRRERELVRMRAAHVGGTHRAYASRTLLFSGIFGLVGSVLGVYLAGVTLHVLSVNAEALERLLPAGLAFLANVARLSRLGFAELFVLLLVSGATVGVALAAGSYWLRWQYLDHLAGVRAREIEASLPRTVAFVYALSRSGMSFPKVLETLTRNEEVYGEAATEVSVAVRDMNAFGTDVLTALRQMAARTPSDDLEEFGENLSSVLASGRSLSTFLREQYERYQNEAESLQEQYLELLSTFAEIYVTVLVAGPLFTITVLVVIGLVIQSTLPALRLIGYLGIPLGTAIFVVYLGDQIRGIGTSRTVDVTREGDAADSIGRSVDAILAGSAARVDGGAVSDGRHERNVERLAAYERVAVVRRWLDDPTKRLLDNSGTTLAVTVAIALGWFAVRAGSVTALLSRTVASIGAPLRPGPGGVLSQVDGPLIEAAILVLGANALLYEVRKRRLNAIDDSVPDFLDRLASVNEAGLTLVESLRRVADSDLGALGQEVRRLRSDIEWGAPAETALRRLERRTGTALVSRSVTLITNAMGASGDLAPVLRIAASEAQNIRRLRRERKQEMLTYLLVIYISFFVFLGIVVALSVAFVPAIEQATGESTSLGGNVPGVVGASDGVFSGLQSVNTAAYELLFFHVTAIQGVCSGLVAGQLGEGRLQDGLKHATALLTASYLVFAFM
jgi:flagellar protein FlaJ